MLLLKFRNCGWVSERVVQARHRTRATGRGNVRGGGSIGKSAPDCEDFRRNLRTSERAAAVDACGRDDFEGWGRQKARIFGKLPWETWGIPGSCPDPEKPRWRTMYRLDPYFRMWSRWLLDTARAMCVRAWIRIRVPGGGGGLAGAGEFGGCFCAVVRAQPRDGLIRVITEHRVIKSHRGSSSWPT